MIQLEHEIMLKSGQTNANKSKILLQKWSDINIANYILQWYSFVWTSLDLCRLMAKMLRCKTVIYALQ